MVCLRLLVLLLLVSLIKGFKIFVYNSKFGASHVKFMGKLADILVRAGHEVTVYAPIVDAACTTNGTKLAKVIIREKDFDGFSLASVQDEVWSGKHDDFWAMYDIFQKVQDLFVKSCKSQLNDDRFMDYLKSEKFDLAIGESSFDLCYYGILRRIGVKNYITTSSTLMGEEDAAHLGIPSMPSYVPTRFSSSKFPFSYFSRMGNLVQTIISNTIKDRMVAGQTIDFLKEKFGEDFDHREEIAKSAFYFVTADEHLDFPRPISHKVVYIGGLEKKESKKLEKPFYEIMNNSTKGVVLVSFGTVALSHAMSQEVKTIFVETFKKFPDITFLWKYEKDEHRIAEGLPNVFTSKWVPQNDLLDHPKLVAFVSHGGMNSALEAATKGVPMVMIPLFADQPRNARMMEYVKWL